MTVTACDRRRHGEGVENSLFSGFHRGGDERIQMSIGEMGHRIGLVFWIMGNDVCCREGQHKVATAMARGGAGAGEAERSALGQSGELPTVEWGISCAAACVICELYLLSVIVVPKLSDE